MFNAAKTWYPGVLISALIGLAAMTLSRQYGMPVMILAILLGLTLHSLSESQILDKGISWSAKPLLSIGVALLGLRIDASILSGSGLVLPVIAIGLVAATLIFGFAISLWLLKDKYFYA